jgi:hypothetical protein
MNRTMNRRRSRRFANLRLICLEGRLAPAAFNALISRAEPTLFADSAGGGTDSNSFPYGITSLDGRYTVFTSPNGNVVAGEVPDSGGFGTPGYGQSDVFVYDRATNTSELVSHAFGSGTAAANNYSSDPVISSDGHYIAFESYATNLVAGLTVFQNTNNVFLYDRISHTNTVISHQYDSINIGEVGGTNGSGKSSQLLMSANGQTIVFSSFAANLVAGFSNPGDQRHTYAFSVGTGQVTLIDHKYGSPTIGASGSSYAYGISSDGRYVAISSGAQNLISQTTNYVGDVYRFDCLTGAIVLISKSVVSGQVSGNAGSSRPRISSDGSLVTFSSNATDLMTGYSGPAGQVFLYDFGAGQLTLVSHSISGSTVGANAASINPNISGNGRYVTYPSLATDLVAGFVDGNGTTDDDQYLYDRLTGQTTLISRKVGTTNVSANGAEMSGLSSISNDGRIVVFGDYGSDLVTGYVDNNGSYGDMYAFDRIANAVTLVDGGHGSPNIGPNGNSNDALVSADGSTIVFTTVSSDIMSGLTDTNGSDDVFVRDLATGDTVLASRRFGGPSLSAGGSSTWVQESADGRYVVYTSMSTNLLPGQVDTEASQDVFLYDRQLNTTTLVSHAWNSATMTANDQSANPMISADGRYVAYTSWATNVVHHFVDGNGPGVNVYTGTDVFLFDRVTGTNQLVSHQAGSDINGGNGTSGTFYPYPDYFLTISGDGRYVGYYSYATDLVAGFVDHNGASKSDVFVYDRVNDTNTLVSHAAGLPVDGGNDASFAPSISGDGRYIAFWSYSSTLVTGMAGAQARNVFIYDQQTGLTTLVSHVPGNATFGGDDWSTDSAISKDGNFVVYQSYATNLVGGSDSNGQFDVFLYNRQTGTNTLVSHRFNSAVNAANARSSIDTPQYATNSQSISDDGRFVVFNSQATDLVSGFVEGYPLYPSDIYLFDRTTGTNVLLSHVAGSATMGGNRNSFGQAVSGNGRFVAFTSAASNILPGVIGGQLYIYDTVLGTTTLATHSLAGSMVGSDLGAYAPVLGHDGSAISMLSQATNIVPGDFNSHQDIIAYVTPPPQVGSLKINGGSVQRSTVRSITVTFDEPVFFSGDPAAAFTLTQNGSGGSVQLAVGSFSNSPNGVLTLNFSGPLTEFGSLIDGQYSLTIDASQVKNIANLDGTGAGVAGVNWVSQPGAIFRLFGDANGDGYVGANDFILFRMNFGGNADMFDFDGDGSVSASDFVQFRLRFGGSI